MNINLKWREVKPKYGPSYKRLFAGNVIVGTVSHSVVDFSELIARTLLPGMKIEESFDSEKQAMERLEKVTLKWFSCCLE